MGRKVNVEQGKQGFQRTTQSPPVPTSGVRPLVRDNTTVGSQQPQVDYRALAIAANEARRQRTKVAVLERAGVYRDPQNYITLEVLTNAEREALEAACWDRSLSEYGDPPKPPEDSTLAALDLAQENPYVGGVLRRCYFESDGSLRCDVSEANYVAGTVEMNAVFAEETNANPDDRQLRFVASLVHGQTEYVNDRDTSSWPYAYPEDGDYPDLDRYVSEETGVSLLAIENSRLAAGVKTGRIIAALGKGHWGPNSG